jgi:hypothetical protein
MRFRNLSIYFGLASPLQPPDGTVLRYQPGFSRFRPAAIERVRERSSAQASSTPNSALAACSKVTYSEQIMWRQPPIPLRSEQALGSPNLGEAGG